MQKYRIEEKIRFVKHIQDELELTTQDITEATYTIQAVKDMRILHQQLKWEAIIIAVCILIKETRTRKQVNIRGIKLTRTYPLSMRDIITVARNLWDYERRERPITYKDYSMTLSTVYGLW